MPTVIALRGRPRRRRGCLDRTATSPALWLVVVHALGTVVVGRGPLDASSSVCLGTILTDLIDGPGKLDLAVDLRNVAPVDPASVEVLVAAVAAVEQRGGTLAIAGVPVEVVRGLKMAGLERLISTTAEPSDPSSATPCAAASRSCHPSASKPRHPSQGRIA